MTQEGEKKHLAVFEPDGEASKRLVDLLARLAYHVISSPRLADLERHLSSAKPVDLIVCNSVLFGDDYHKVVARLGELLVGHRGGPPLLLLSPLHLSLDAREKLLALGCADVLSLEAPFLELVFAINRILFPKIRELRRYTRVFGGFPVEYSTPGRTGRGEVYNISQEGAFIQCEHPEGEGTRLVMRFDLPGDRQPIEVEAVVSWRSGGGGDFSPAGMGVSFLALADEPSRSLRRFISGRANGNR